MSFSNGSVPMATMKSAFHAGIAVLLLFGEHPLVAGESPEHVPGAGAPHTCVVLTPGESRPEFGCFRIGIARNLKFGNPSVFWHLQRYPSRAAADAAKSPSGIVVEEAGTVWLSEFGSTHRVPKGGGHRVAEIGPLSVVPDKRYDAEVAYSIMAPSDRSRVHTHSGPEAWYVLAGAQCLETPAGTRQGVAGETMSAKPNVPMQLSVTGADVAKALTLVMHDSTQEFGTASDWKPSGACQRLNSSE
jgi:quercetin dioxygenase-like cupin family protein